MGDYEWLLFCLAFCRWWGEEFTIEKSGFALFDLSIEIRLDYPNRVSYNYYSVQTYLEYNKGRSNTDTCLEIIQYSA